MKPSRLLLTLLLSCSLSTATLAQDTGHDRAALEAGFEARMSDSRMVGFFTLDASPEGTAPQKDSYTLGKVTKAEGNKWRFEAQIEYGDKAIPIALKLPVEWAGDTPVISVTDMSFPMLGEYSARVVIYGDQYAGVWTGKGYGGQMYGKIVKVEAQPGGGEPVQETGANWPSFRGPRASGVADGWETPREWNVPSSENVKWSTEVPGLAHSSPVIWGERVFVTTAVREGEEDAELRIGLYGDIQPVADEGEHEFRLVCLDKETGREMWSRTAHVGTPVIKRHTKGSHAASSPATDGEFVVAFFGTEGLYCYDVEGELLWEKDFGVLDSGYFAVRDAQWGFASSPVIHDGLVIVQCDVQEQSFVAALRVEDGTEVWRTLRQEAPGWSTPTIVESDGRTQVVCNGWQHIGGYDFETGAELWKLRGGGDVPVPTPILVDDLIFITNAHGRMAPILAIETDAAGELSLNAEENEHVRWSLPRRGNYMQTPLAYGELVYFCNDAGILACYEAASGEEVYRERLGGGGSGFTGSGVAADGKLYFTSEEGEVYVVAAGPAFEVLSVNDLGETFMSTPAISEGVLFFRSRYHLTAVGGQDS